jgi:hypothetical protein
MLHLPQRLTVRFTTFTVPGFKIVPYSGRPVAIVVHTYARERNDYFLGPCFSTNDLLTVTHDQFVYSIKAHLDWGLMDHAAIEGSFSLVEIRPLWASEVNRAIAFRRSSTVFSKHEESLWRSKQAYLELLADCVNHKLPAVEDTQASGRIRAEWSEPAIEREYELCLPAAAV